MSSTCSFKLIILLLLLTSTILDCFPQQEKRNLSIKKKLDKAKIFLSENEEDNAIPLLNSILKKKPTHDEALMLRAKAYNNLQMFDKALIDYNGLCEILPNEPEILYGRGITRFQLQLYRLAIDDFIQVLDMPGNETKTAFFKIDPSTNSSVEISTITTIKADVWNYIGLCYLRLQEYDHALNAFTEGLMLSRNSPDLLINRGLTYEEFNDPQSALRDYNSALAIDPNNERASYNALRLRMANDKNEMIEALTSFIDENPELGEGYSARGLQYYEMEMYNFALIDFERAVKLDPHNLDYQFNLALCLEKENRLDESGHYFLSIINSDSKHSGAYFNLGNLKYKKGLFNEAISYYTLAFHHNQKNVSILYNRALAHYKNGQIVNACEDINKVMVEYPQLAEDFYSRHCKDLE